MIYWTSRSEFIGHAVFTILPGFFLLLVSMYMFRYTGATNFYDRFWADKTTTDYFKYGDMVQGYGGVTLWLLSFVTSILAWNGISVELNMIVWNYFMVVLGSIIAISGFVLKFLAFDSAWGDMEDADGVAATAAFTNIMLDFAVQTTMLSSVALIFYFYWDHWKYAMWIAIGEEA